MKVVLVTGGRAYADQAKINAVLTEEAPDLVIHGGAKTWVRARHSIPLDEPGGHYVGADYFASVWADDHDVPQLKVPYLRKHGKAGGPIRNRVEVGFLVGFRTLGDECSVIAFPGNTGTADTVSAARCVGFEIREIRP